MQLNKICNFTVPREAERKMCEKRERLDRKRVPRREGRFALGGEKCFSSPKLRLFGCNNARGGRVANNYWAVGNDTRCCVMYQPVVIKSCFAVFRNGWVCYDHHCAINSTVAG